VTASSAWSSPSRATSVSSSRSPSLSVCNARTTRASVPSPATTSARAGAASSSFSRSWSTSSAPNRSPIAPRSAQHRVSYGRSNDANRPVNHQISASSSDSLWRLVTQQASQTAAFRERSCLAHLPRRFSRDGPRSRGFSRRGSTMSWAIEHVGGVAVVVLLAGVELRHRRFEAVSPCSNPGLALRAWFIERAAIASPSRGRRRS
jgi:hypothetical protein